MGVYLRHYDCTTITAYFLLQLGYRVYTATMVMVPRMLIAHNMYHRFPSSAAGELHVLLSKNCWNLVAMATKLV